VQLRLDFLEEVNGGAPPAGLRQSLHDYFQATLPTAEFQAWLATANGQIVGTSGLVYMSRPPSHNNLSGRDAYIMNMYTLAAWRGRGIGTALFQQVLNEIQRSGCEKVLLHATEQGRALYEKFGFRVSGGEMRMSLTIAAPPTSSHL
jgi:GNAT superfamily N-acetyltransferase